MDMKHILKSLVVVSILLVVAIGCGPTRAATAISRARDGLYKARLAGADDYQRLDGSGRNRWGDYSATLVDPSDPTTFWTFQEWVIGDNRWAVQITSLQITAVPEPSAFALSALGLAGLFAALRRRRRAIAGR